MHDATWLVRKSTERYVETEDIPATIVASIRAAITMNELPLICKFQCAAAA
jgi:hypothetical protein